MLTATIAAAFSGLPTEILGHYFGKVADFLGAELTSDLDWKVWKAKNGFGHNNSDFPERYAQAILSLREAVKPQPLLKFFADPSVFALIHEHWYGEKDNAQLGKEFSELADHFTLRQQIVGFSADQVLSAFLDYQRKAVNLNRTAGERESHQVLLEIAQEVRKPVRSEHSPFSGLIDRIDKQFLQEQKGKTGLLITPEGFYMANGPAQWWGVMNGLVAPKVLYHGLPQRITNSFHDSAPVLALLDGSGGMGKTTAARQLVADLCERFECWWVDELGGEELDEAMPEFLESRVQYGRETLMVLDDWGKYSEGLRRTLGQFMRRQQRKGEATNLRFIVTAKPDEHADLSHDQILLTADTRVSFDADKYLKTDNENLLKLALAHLPKELAGLYEKLFNPEDRLIGKPFHLLFILLRAADDLELRQSLTQNNAEGKFWQVMQYDFDQLYRDEERRGLVVAMLFFAYVKHTQGSILTYEAFVALANRYSSGEISPGQRLAAQAPEQWPILNHYLTKIKTDKLKRSDAPEFIQFKKDEYPEYLLQLNLTNGKTATAFLEVEKKLIVQFLLENGGNQAASTLAYIFSQREALLTEQEQIATVEIFLSRGIDQYGYTTMFLTPKALPSVSFEQKWAWIKRFNEFAPQNGHFHMFCVKFIKQIQRETWFDYVSALINLGADSVYIWMPFLNGASAETRKAEAKRLMKVENQDQSLITFCLGLLRNDPEAKIEAKRLLKVENQNPFVICRCLDLLREEAKPEARQLLKENKHSQVICRCLDLLREEAKPEARQLLKIENQDAMVICRCLDLLRDEAKPESRQLLKESKNYQVICRCLELLGEEAKPEARKLLKKSRNRQITCRCLDLLGKEVKPEARQLLKESKSPDVICRCLDLLGEEAKPEARQLLKESKDKGVICRCLDLLGEEAKPEARQLLKESKYPDVICRCLDLLGEEAKPEARQLLKESQIPEVICRCLDLLRNDPETKNEAMRLLKVVNQDAIVLCRCLLVLKKHALSWPDANDYCLGILQNWQKENQMLVGNCLDYLSQHPLSISVMQQVFKEKHKYVVLYIYIMRYGCGQQEFWKQEVRHVIQNWRGEHRTALWRCLIHLETEPDFVRACCQQILQRWEPECLNTMQRLAQKKKASDRYLQKALSHPQLSDLATTTAQAMYAREQAEPGFLTFYLRELVVGIVEQGVWPPWESAEGTEALE